VSGETDGPAPGDSEPVGSVAEEAAKLLGALSGWAREHSEGLSSFGDGVHEHTGGHDGATPGAECAWCPVCRTVAAVRQTSPEVLGHLTTAAASLMLAASGIMATLGEAADQTRSGGQDGTGVERIPLDDGWPEDDR
jgi:hypothetical protein